MDNQQILFSNFESALDQSINDAWGSQQLEAHLNKLEAEAKLLAEEAKKVGDTSQARHADGNAEIGDFIGTYICLLYTSPSPRDATLSRMPSSA